ncbi:hypothetical protein ACP70R_039086 [Stipagrostis hirtigluma subsp. patula]
MRGAGARLSLPHGIASHLRVPPPRRLDQAAAAAKTNNSKDEDCRGFLQWLQRKAGTQISSLLTVGTSAFGRSLFALEAIKEGDCIMEVPYDVQLTQDKLPQEVLALLDNVVDDTAKIAVLLMMEQHLGHESGWAPYVKSLPCKDQMHNMTFWDLNELHMVRISSIHNAAIQQKDRSEKEFSAVKPVLEHFSHLFGAVNMEDFIHASALVSSRAWQTLRGVSLIPFADFLNHDGLSNSILLCDEQKNVCEVIADRNYAAGEQVMIRYGKYSNATLALNFGFTLSRNVYDEVHIWIEMPGQDPLCWKKLDLWERHHRPKSEDMLSCGCIKTDFVIKKVKSSRGKGTGVPEILRAFFRVFCATSLEELEEMTMEAARNDGRLARRPLENTEKEIHAHRMLLLHLNEKIHGYSAAIEDWILEKVKAEETEVAGCCSVRRATRIHGGGQATSAPNNQNGSTIISKYMEHRVKCMLLLLGEEADSFSKRAEMYYKRRPEVITQVEEVYRAYRGLADRYDIMSGELHKANHTIATAFPDQVQYAMLEEEDDNIPKAFTPVDPRKIHKSTVDGLMKKKKKGEHPPLGGKAKKNNNTSPPINKENAREEISRLQKAILVMQTEKEFIKSSYETGIAKYWDLEKEINEMQEQVCQFQDKFDESAVIEDDEARALMTASALKSCEDTIVKLQEQRKASAGQAMGESERVKVLREKVKAVMNQHGKSLQDPLDCSEKYTRKNHVAEMEDVYHVKQGEIELQAVIDKIKEHFERDCNISMAEITERIDELVNKVVDLELMVSSETSQIDRLCRENNDLENSLKSLEEENTTLASDPSELNEKVKQVEEELIRVQALESSFHRDESTIRSNFIETISRFSDLSELLQSPVCENNTGSASAHSSHEAPAVHESTEPSSNEPCDVKEEESPQIAANNAESTSGDVEPDDHCDNAKASGIDESADSTKSSVQESDAGQDKSSRERGSLARLRHISSGNLGGQDDKEDISKEGLSSSADDLAKLQERLANSLDDKEKVLIVEYTSLLQDYKDAKRRLTEVEKKNQECMHEIRSLREELQNSAGGDQRSSHRGHRRTPSYSSFHHRRPSVSSLSRMIRMGSTVQEGRPNTDTNDAAAVAEQGGINFNPEDLRLPAVAEAENISPLEEKFRRDIDTLLDENLEFWMKFSSSLQRVQEFQSKHDDLQSGMRKLLINSEDGKQQGVAEHPSAKATERQLRALKTELQVWSEQNAMLRGELQCRFTSLCDIQEEITAALDMDSDGQEEEARFTSYQAAKFQGEVLNMQQENNRVSDELQAGLDHVKGIQAEIEQALAKLHRSVSLSPQQPEDESESSKLDGGHGTLARVPSKAKVPLQSFLFPAKAKKPSLLARVTPVLQKQQVEMKFLAKLPR